MMTSTSPSLCRRCTRCWSSSRVPTAAPTRSFLTWYTCQTLGILVHERAGADHITYHAACRCRCWLNLPTHCDDGAHVHGSTELNSYAVTSPGSP